MTTTEQTTGPLPAQRFVGESVKRSEDKRILTGTGRYVDDIQLPGMLHAAFLRSPFAHARITGIDVSEHALAHALPSVRDRIVLGDLLSLDVGHGYDLVAGLDVFEHLNPNRIDAYLRCLAEHLREGGWCVANIPVYGTDPVFGNVFLDFLAEPTPSTLFRRVHVDDRGYPLHGHLIWATWDWWVDRFAAAGLERRPAVEEAVQARYGAHWKAATPARQSLFVFRRGDGPGEDEVLASLRSPSAVLSGHAPPPG